MRLPLRVAGAAVPAIAVLAFPVMVGAPAQGGVATRAPSINWRAYLDGPEHHSHSPATAITPATVPRLTRAWSFMPARATKAGQPGPRLFASPTVVDGRVYIGANTGVFYALNEATGHVLWHRFLGFVTKKHCGARGFTSTATVAPDPKSGALTVYVAAANGYLYALNAATGATKWRSVVAIPSATVSDYYNWGSPTVVRGRVYMGVSSQCDHPLVMGGLKEYRQSTGALLAFYRTNPAGPTGPSIWSSAAVTFSGSAVFVTTGNGLGPNQISVIRLDPATLAKVSSWQVPASQLGYDSDFGGSPTLFSAKLGTRTVPLAGACNKNGVYYAFRRNDLRAGPLWQVTVGTPAAAPPECVAAAAWDGSHLFIGANQTTIGGISYAGSIRSLDPATGAPAWQVGLAGPVIGSPTLDAGGVLAVPTYSSAGVYLLDAATGAILADIATGPDFGQPVFADRMLLIPTKQNGLWAYRPAS